MAGYLEAMISQLSGFVGFARSQGALGSTVQEADLLEAVLFEALASGQPVLELEVEACRLCLEAAGLSTADVDVASGQAKRVFVVVSCAYSRFTDENDPVCWANGDGAAALLIGAVDAGDLTLLFGIGSASNAASAVLRLGHVSLGPVASDGVEPA